MAFRVRSRLVRVSVALHGAGVFALALAPSWWTAILGVLIADHLVLVGSGLWPRGTWLGPNLRSLPRGEAEGYVALTFDDGPHPEVTPRVLDVLDEHDARATFFCVGRRAEAHPALVREIVRRGHGVENHSLTHRTGFFFLPPEALAREIDDAQEILASVAAKRPVYFRAPAGIRSPLLDPMLAARGLTLASWSRRGFDTVSRDPSRVLRRLVSGVRDGDILVLHDSSAREVDGEPLVLRVLPRLLAELRSRGLSTALLPGSRER